MGRNRYDGLATAKQTVPDGAGGTREVAYLLQRVPRDPSGVTPLAVHRVRADDRADLLADRYLGDPQAWWRICDDNTALDPDDLVGPGNDGGAVVIGVPEA